MVEGMVFDCDKWIARQMPQLADSHRPVEIAQGIERVPTELMAEYYKQRASAGLIISEATSVDAMGVGYPDTPGIWSEEQVAGWARITSAVHAAGGRMVLQLWHVGRVSDPVYLNGERPVAPSAIAPSGHVSLVRPLKPFEVPRALETSEIPGIIARVLMASLRRRLHPTSRLAAGRPQPALPGDTGPYGALG